MIRLRPFDTPTDTPKQMWFVWYLVVVLEWAVMIYAPEVDGACVVETPPLGAEAGLVIHLLPGCTTVEREAHAVRSEAVMDAIAQGRSVDLLGVIVRGDLIFDYLTAQTTSRPLIPATDMTDRADHVGDDEQRIVREILRIRHSVVTGAVRHRSVGGTLRFERTVDLSGSHFREGVDLSRSVFQEAVDLSSATFEKEAYFVQGQFVRQMDCRETKFGPSTRFHRSVFRGSVNCTDARFDGMAEFLEVKFEQPVSFERSRFGLGTGFSGSRFLNRASFSEAIFSRETFFGFATFENEAVFSGAQFLGSADFSNAEFTRQDDLAKARFDQPPLLAQTKRFGSDQQPGLSQARSSQYAFTLVVLVLAALLVAYAAKMK